MAMDALKNLVNNIPDWLQRLGDLSAQIDCRQAELAAVAAAEGRSPETISLRNKGSTESLKPKDDPPVVYAEAPVNDDSHDSPPSYKAHMRKYATAKTSEIPNVYMPSSGSIPKQRKTLEKRPASEEPECETDRKKYRSKPIVVPNEGAQGSGTFNSSSPEPRSEPMDNPPPYKDVMHADAAKGTAPKPLKKPETLARRRAEGRKKPKLPPVMSNEDAPVAEHTQTKIIVYYDSYVQGFFYDLVKFVSSSRNLMRKAKMAARFAQIKKLAEQDVSEDGNNDDAPPSQRYMSSRRFGPMSISRSGAGDQPPDVFDNLDKGLEFVQSMCEQGAHQFLRDGDCNDEISKAQKRLGEVLELAKTEMERLQRGEPELAKVTGEMGNPTPIKKLKPGKLEAAEPSPAGDPMVPLASDPTHGDGVFAVSLDNGRGPEIARADSHPNDERRQQAPERLKHQHGRTKLPSSPRKKIPSPRRKEGDEHQTFSTHSVASVDIPPYTTNAAYTRA
jgi:hypothetical protein